ncbi:Para-hydroxybenzoate--polyprenyltransferase, mitochondrial precursor (PHB:polyprenyltransferase) [Rhizina undulata]
MLLRRAPSSLLCMLHAAPRRTIHARPFSPQLSLAPHRPSPSALVPFRPACLRLAATAASQDLLATPRSQTDIYEPPKTGFLSLLPSSVIPYAELVRLDKPTGTIYLFLPCLWSTLLASTMSTPPVDIPNILSYTFLFGAGALIMRGAGCTINDLWDRKIDPLVTRTKFRPIARGAITPVQSLVFTSAQLLAGLGILVQFPLECIVYGIPSLILVASYPLMKRITHYPQFVLGLSFSWGALLGFPAVGLSLADPTVLTAAACLYGSNVAWTILYDTIYAHQDVSDDVKAGVKSIVVKHESHTKALMTGLGVVQLGLLATAGIVTGCGPLFYVASCGGAASGLGYMIFKANLKNVKECWSWFKWSAWAVGGVAIAGGLALEYTAIRMGLYGEEGWWGLGGMKARRELLQKGNIEETAVAN